MNDNTKNTVSFTTEWTKRLMQGIQEQEEGTETASSCFEACAAWHYEYNDMDRLIQNYIGNMPDFLAFLEREWGWKITVSEDKKEIFIDENKDFCVCPVAQKMGEPVPQNLCRCSEAFAKKMFSAVAGKEVQASVIRSVIRDGKSCIYEIRL